MAKNAELMAWIIAAAWMAIGSGICYQLWNRK